MVQENPTWGQARAHSNMTFRETTLGGGGNRGGNGDSCTQWMILRIVHDVVKEPSTRSFFEIRIVERAVRGIAIGSCHNGINDVRRF